MTVTIGGIKYWTRKDYLQSLGIPRSRNGIEIAIRPDAYTSGLAPGGIWQRSESGIALYLPGRKDIRAELQPTADELKAAAEAIARARPKSRKDKVRVLIDARTGFAGIGTRKAKLALNKLAKTDPYAHALRIALEIEDANLTAKRYFGGDCGGCTYTEIHYLKKVENIDTLIGIAKSQGWVFGVQSSCVFNTTHIVYFEIPGVGQVSWHYSPREPLPVYPGQWDEKEGSTLPKLEAAISKLLPESRCSDKEPERRAPKGRLRLEE